MYAEDLSLDDCCEREIIEGVIKIIPNVMITIFFCDLIIEAVYVCDISRFVVPSEQHYHLRILHLVEEEEENSLDRVEASVNVVAEEDVTFLWNLSSLSEELQQIPELAMDIATNSYWSLYWLHVRLLE